MAGEKPKNEKPVMINPPQIPPIKKRDASGGTIIHK